MNKRNSIKLINYSADRRLVLIDWHDGHQSRYPYIWLRHSINYPVLGRPEQNDGDRCRIPESPDEPVLESIGYDSKAITLHWSHDNSVTHHSLQGLRQQCNADQARSLNSHKPVLWKIGDAASFHWHHVDDLNNPTALLGIFTHLRDYGIVLINNLPVKPETLFDIARNFGPVRRTHFGELFDIRSLPPDQLGTGENIGATASNSQAPHMDEGWRHGPPGISFFHCLKSEADAGGASQFVDGIAAAESLRQNSPQSYKFLNSVPLVFAAERNLQERFRTRARMIATDYEGIVRGVRVSDRNMAPIDLPENQIESAYAALHDWAITVYAAERIFEHQLRPGELVIFDNHRVLHARSAFNPLVGERWIQQLSVDREEFHNVFRQLAEKLGDESIKHWEPDAGLLSQSDSTT